jgi:hypothetical protein
MPRKARFHALLDKREVMHALTFDFSEVDIRIPRLAQRPRHRARYAGKLANVIQLGKTAFIKRRLDTGLHLLCRNGVGETAGKSRGHLRQG